MPTVYLETADGRRLPVLDIEPVDPGGVERMAATIGALAEEAPAVFATATPDGVVDSDELAAVHEVVEAVLVDAGLPVVDHDEFAARLDAPEWPDPDVMFTHLAVQAGDLYGRFQLQAESGLPPQLFKYWATGDGAAKIRWGSKGDFTRCTQYLRKYVDDQVEEVCANLHRDATGYWPGDKKGQQASTAVTIYGLDADTVTVADLNDAESAADRLRRNQTARVSPADAVLVLEALADDVDPTDLTLLTVHGTGNFRDVANRAYARVDMPQIPPPRLDTFAVFLAEHGVGVHRDTADPATLRATQNQLDGRKTGKFLRSARTGALDDSALWISDDRYLLDGHHRWAAQLVLSAVSPFTVDVVSVDLPMARLLDLARRFNEIDGIDAKAHGEFRWNPFQRRHPKGTPEGGRWAPDDDGLTIGRVYPVPSPEKRAAIAEREKRHRDKRAEAGRLIGPTRDDLNSGAAALFGKGQNEDPATAAAALFGDAQITTIPFRSAGRRKNEPLFDRAAVAETLARPFGLRRVDPRVLYATQRNVTRQGVEYYLTDHYDATGATYADQHDPGNRFPVVYRNPRNGQHLILSGHHRAVAALLQGRPLHAVYVNPDPDPLVAAAATVEGVKSVKRDVTVLLAIDPDDPAPASVPDAVAALRVGRGTIVANDADAVAALIALGISERDAEQRVRWSLGVDSLQGVIGET